MLNLKKRGLGRNKNSKGIVILGHSAGGKTDLAIKVAKKLGRDVLSADSRQVYVGLDYSTGKHPNKKLKFEKRSKFWDIEGVKYWGYDLISPDSIFSAGDYVIFSNGLLERAGCLPILCGGTGMYIRALTSKKGLEGGTKNADLRERLRKLETHNLLENLQKRGFDINKLNNSERNNKQRLIRKIELVENKSETVLKSNFPTEEECIFVGLRKTKKEYQTKIEIWVNRDFEKIKNEVKKLKKDFPQSPLFTGFIFREINQHLQRKLGERETKNLITTKYLQFINRQNTFFNNQFTNINWFSNSKDAYNFICLRCLRTDPC